MAIIKPDNYSADYILQNQSIFRMGAANPVLKMTCTTDLTLHQTVVKENIRNTIITHSQTLETDNSELKPVIDEMRYIAEISKTLHLKRKSSGEIDSVDRKTLENDWDFWKKNKIQNFIPEEYKQK